MTITPIRTMAVAGWPLLAGRKRAVEPGPAPKNPSAEHGLARAKIPRGGRIGLAMTNRTLAAFAIAAVGLGSAGCKASTGSAHAPSGASVTTNSPSTKTAATTSGTAVEGAPTTCLVSPAEASAAFGSDAGTPTIAGFQCSYTTSAGSLTVFASPNGGAQFFDAERSAASSEAGFKDEAGVGDRAFLGEGVLVFVKGPKVVTIAVQGSAIPTAAALAELGRAAAGRA